MQVYDQTFSWSVQPRQEQRFQTQAERISEDSETSPKTVDSSYDIMLSDCEQTSSTLYGNVYILTMVLLVVYGKDGFLKFNNRLNTFYLQFLIPASAPRLV